MMRHERRRLQLVTAQLGGEEEWGLLVLVWIHRSCSVCATAVNKVDASCRISAVKGHCVQLWLR